ncbi:SAM-dependent methyltransferase, partial [Achromobacter sp. SIMBA_011]
MTSCRTHAPAYVPEPRFRIWFLRTHTWEYHVLRVAIYDLKQLIGAP